MGVKLSDIKDERLREKLRGLANLGAGGGVDNGRIGATVIPDARREVIAPFGSARPARPHSRYSPSVVLAYFAECGLPAPVTEHRFHPTRKWRFDFAWPAHRVALEVEGGVWTGGRHTRGTGFAADIEKYNAAAAAGWRVLRCVPKDLCMMSTVGMIKTALLWKQNFA